jgi:phospholipase C
MRPERGSRSCREMTGPPQLVLLAMTLTWGLVPLVSCTQEGSDQASHGAPATSGLGNEPSERSVQRLACSFRKGARGADTLNVTDPLGSTIPIDHFIVIMQENRSFDHYFEMLPERGQADADVAPKGFANWATDQSDHAEVGIFHETAYCNRDIEHGWNGVHKQYADGEMNGFVVASNGSTSVMGYYDEPDLPYYYALARTFSIGDRYFSSVMGPTFPNRMFAVAGTSFGVVKNDPPPAESETQTIFHRLQETGQDFVIYSDQHTFEERMFPELRSEPGEHFASIEHFLEDADSGKLPALAWVQSRLIRGANADDEHPPADVQLGEAFVSSIIAAVMHGSDWPSSAIFITYDEHGGFFDHVPPPRACVPDGAEPLLTQDMLPGRFDRLGMRVPFIVVSPFAKRHHVSHSVLSHTSILRMIEVRFDLPAVSARTANDEPPFDLFDFSKAEFAVPPALPEPTIDSAELERCRSDFP